MVPGFTHSQSHWATNRRTSGATVWGRGSPWAVPPCPAFVLKGPSDQYQKWEESPCGRMWEVLASLIHERRAVALREALETGRDAATVVSEVMEGWLFVTPKGQLLPRYL